MKGWLDRTFLPDVAFTLDTSVQANLTNIRRLVGITTYGSKRTDVAILGDAGRRTITRTVRLVCRKRCRTTWLGLHQLDTSTADDRTAFLDRIDAKLTAAAGRR